MAALHTFSRTQQTGFPGASDYQRRKKFGPQGPGASLEQQLSPGVTQVAPGIYRYASSGGGGLQSPWGGTTEQTQKRAMQSQLGQIEQFAEQLYGPVFQQLQQAVQQGLQQPGSAFADAAHRELARGTQELTHSAQQQQQALEEQMGARGMGRSGLQTEGIKNLERARLGESARMQESVARAIAEREAQEQMQAQQQAMSYQQMLASVMGMVPQMTQQVYGGIQYPPPVPQQQTWPEEQMMDELRRTLDQVRQQPTQLPSSQQPGYMDDIMGPPAPQPTPQQPTPQQPTPQPSDRSGTGRSVSDAEMQKMIDEALGLGLESIGDPLRYWE